MRVVWRMVGGRRSVRSTVSGAALVDLRRRGGVVGRDPCGSVDELAVDDMHETRRLSSALVQIGPDQDLVVCHLFVVDEDHRGQHHSATTPPP